MHKHHSSDTPMDDRGEETIPTERHRRLFVLLTTGERYKDHYVKHSFRAIESKKNAVAYCLIDGKPRIVKWYPPGLKYQMQREHLILSKGSPTVPMPIVVEKDDDNVALIMTYIPGENLCDLLNYTTTTYEEKSRLMKLLAEWFAQFHTHYRKDEERYIRGDAILRNFIFSDKIWGVDFEEARKGKPIEDIACLVASYLSTDPMFSSEKFRLCTQLISSYESIAGCALLTIADETAYALLQRIQWRQNDEELLRTYAEHIRQHGIVVKEVAGNQVL